MSFDALIQPILDFLLVPTPKAWVDSACESLPELLGDHANCEKKAASMAMTLMSRYPTKKALLFSLSKLAREELLHFEQVLEIMNERGIAYTGRLSASRYAKVLHTHIRAKEPHRAIDTLIIGAIIEARSCERFYALIPHVDRQLSLFYQRLIKSEARHFDDYLTMISAFSDSPADDRIQFLLEVEKELVTSKDKELRFHSGVPFNISLKSGESKNTEYATCSDV